MEIETHYCELCDEPLMNSSTVGWTCKNDNCVINKFDKDAY